MESSPARQPPHSGPCLSPDLQPRNSTNMDTASRKLNPLDLPEIVIRVGQFLPLWTSEGFHREFQPKPLLNACLVSHSFRNALLPILWFCYDGFRMRNVPSQVLYKYSHLFRIIANTGPFKGPFRCRNLIELSTVYGQEWSRELLVSNPGLKRLVWGGPFHRRIETLEQQQEWELELKALMGLGNLDVLTTSGFSLGEGIFVKMLRNNAQRLSNLQLSTVVEGVTSIEGLELPHLTELHITFGGTESPALVDLVRCCPRLSRLSLTGSRSRSSAATTPMMHQQQQFAANNTVNINNHITNNPHLENFIMDMDPALINNNSIHQEEFQIERLAENIAECCPELASIKFTSTSSSTGWFFLNDHESAALVNACIRLESFSADMVTLDHALTESLVGQRGSLHSLTLSFHESEQEQTGFDRLREVHCVRRIKASLGRLRELTLSWDRGLMSTTTTTFLTSSSPHDERDNDRLEKEVGAFLEEPWACLGLETLTLSGLPAPSPGRMSVPSAAMSVSVVHEQIAAGSGSDPSSIQAPLHVQSCWKLLPKQPSFSAHNSNSSTSISSMNSRSSSRNSHRSSSSNSSTNAEMMQNLLLSLNLLPLKRLRSLYLNHASYERASADDHHPTAIVV